MRVAVGSANPVKLQAVKLAFTSLFPETQWEILPAIVPSGISDQPMSDLVSIKGARTRAKRAIALLRADYGVGLEGGLQKLGRQWFDCGWIVAVDKYGKEGIGSTIKIPTPVSFMRLIRKGIELGVANDLIFQTQNSKQKEGHFGIMTRGIITRTTGYRDGVIAALSRFVHPELFEN